MKMTKVQWIRTIIDFDSKKVVTPLNAADVENYIGKEGYFADSFLALTRLIEMHNEGVWEDPEDVDRVLGVFGTLEKFDTKELAYKPKEYNNCIFDYFYPVEPVKE